VASWFSRLFFSFQLPGPLVRYFLIGTDAPQELAEQFQQAIQAVAPDVLAGRLKSLVNVDVRDELRDCEKPILYLQARRDKLVSKKCLQEILLLKPNLENVTIDAPHLVLQREPERAVKAIEEFLQKQTP
jgi:pimeloyl-ACP methyl ester carboxylesterase